MQWRSVSWNVQRNLTSYKKKEKRVNELEEKRSTGTGTSFRSYLRTGKKEELLKSVEDDVKVDVARLYKELENRAKEEANKKAKEYVVNAIKNVR